MSLLMAPGGQPGSTGPVPYLAFTACTMYVSTLANVSLCTGQIQRQTTV